MSSTGSRPQLPKRFYRDVTIGEVDEGYGVFLDARPVKTPGRKTLVVPSLAAAETLRREWDAQEERIDPATMAMTRFANTVVETIFVDPVPVRDDIGRYVETDLLFYRAEGPQELVERQRAGWDPILDWVRETTGARFVLAEGVMHVAQPETSIAAVRRAFETSTDPFEIAALHQATTLTGSALLALALRDGRVDAREAWSLGHLDEDWNIEQWGADEEASERRSKRWQEMAVASIFLHPAKV